MERQSLLYERSHTKFNQRISKDYRATWIAPITVNKSNAIISGLLGIVIVLVAYSIILNPPQKTPTIDDIGRTTKIVVGDQTSQDLTLTEIFEKTESGVVKINVKRPNDQ